MRLSDILGLLEGYMGMCVFLLACMAVIGCFVLFYLKKRKHYDLHHLPKIKIISTALFICYMVVLLGATMLSRGGPYMYTRLNLHLFSSYKEAWYHASLVEWRNLILNILLFVPMGFLLPLVWKRANRFYKVYLTGFLTSAGIEFLQYVLHRGIVEADDVFNNTLGTMIGYGLFILCSYLVRLLKKEKQNPAGKCMAAQIPLILTLGMFSAIAIVYQKQEFGNLSDHYIYRQNMNNISVSCEEKFSEQETSQMVYRLKIADKKEMQEYADSVFQKVGTTVDSSQNDVYENTIVYRSKDNTCSMWVYYKGMRADFTNFSLLEEESAGNFSKQEVLEVLQQYGIVIPKQAEMEVSKEGEYTFILDKLMDGENMTDGSLICKITKDKKIKSYQNNIISYENYAKKDCISESQAFSVIQKGDFLNEQNLTSLHITGVKLAYCVDSKGFYQPVYVFAEQETGNKIVVPAVK